MDYGIARESSFNGVIKNIVYKDKDYFIGIANLREGCQIYFPQAGIDYILIMFNNIVYRFPFTEFTLPFREVYLCEKLRCSKEEAELVYAVVKQELYKDAAQALLLGETNNNPISRR